MVGLWGVRCFSGRSRSACSRSARSVRLVRRVRVRLVRRVRVRLVRRVRVRPVRRVRVRPAAFGLCGAPGPARGPASRRDDFAGVGLGPASGLVLLYGVVWLRGAVGLRGLVGLRARLAGRRLATAPEAVRRGRQGSVSDSASSSADWLGCALGLLAGGRNSP